MKTLASVLMVSAVLVWPARAGEIPEHLKGGAERTFASGKPFFIWTTVQQPVVGRGNGAIVPIKWAAKTPDQNSFAKTPFCLRAATTTVDVKGVTNNYCMTLGPFRNVKQGEELQGMVGSRGRKLVSASVVYSLVPVDSHGPTPEAVSNTVEVKVDFKD